MSSDNGKKRKVQGDGSGGVGKSAAAAMPTRDMMAEMKAMLEQNCLQMKQMQNKVIDTMQQHHDEEMNEMKRTHKMEIETIKEQHEIDIESMKNQLKQCEDRCSSLERSVKVLAKDVKWEYSAPDIPDSHWLEQGHDERYVEGVNSFLGDLRDTSREMRAGGSIGSIYLGYDDHNGPGRYPVVLHDDLLIPHWKEFTDAIQLYDCSDTRLTISNVQLHPNICEMLAAALKAKKIEGFYLIRNDFARVRDGINFAIQVAKSVPTLTMFGWVHNPINSMEDARCLFEGISSCPHIERLGLGCCGEGVNGYGVLFTLLECNLNLKYIVFELNNVRIVGNTYLTDFLATNPPLETLSLENNQFNDNDAAMIASALKRNTNLEGLYLTGNEMTRVGRGAIAKALFDPSSLNAAAASNHTCILRGIGIRRTELASNRHHGPAENRARKIYSILSDRNKNDSNIQHLDMEFGDDSVKFVPKVLECVHAYSEPKRGVDVPPISILYEILRTWRMPELYKMR